MALWEEAKAFAISSSRVKNYATYTRYYYIDKSVSVENRPLVSKVHKKRHPGFEWCIFYILSSEDIDDVISRLYTVICAKIILCI